MVWIPPVKTVVGTVIDVVGADGGTEDGGDENGAELRLGVDLEMRPGVTAATIPTARIRTAVTKMARCSPGERTSGDYGREPPSWRIPVCWRGSLCRVDGGAK